MHKLKKVSFRLAALLLVMVLLGTLSALASSPTDAKVVITAERKDDFLTVTLQMRDISFNAMSIVLGYDRAVLTPVQSDGTVVETAQDAFDLIAPVYQPGSWTTPASGWLSPVVPGIQMDKGAGILQYSFYVEPNGEGVDPETSCLTVPTAGTNILKLRFKVLEQSTLRYSSIYLASNYFGNPTGIQILDSELNGIIAPATVQIDLSNVAVPDESDSGAGTDNPDSSNKPSGGESGSDQPPSGQGILLKDTSGHWAEKDIARLAEAGIITGDSRGYFYPDRPVTRAELAVMVTKAYHLTFGGSTMSFADISGHWAEKEMLASARQGYFLGSGGAFSPDRSITREELAVVISRIKGVTPEGVPDYTDAAQCSSWAAGAIAALQEMDLMTGLSDGSFRPQAAVTKAEAAVVLVRCLGK